MFRRNTDNNTKVNVAKVNELINIGNKILKVVFVLCVVMAIYAII